MLALHQLKLRLSDSIKLDLDLSISKYFCNFQGEYINFHQTNLNPFMTEAVII